MFSEDEFIPISALSHYSYCKRRCALIHIEQIWKENRFTAEGRIMHEHVHEVGNESRGYVNIARALPLRSLELGLVGVADVVEFYRISDGVFRPFPVEYKRGKPKKDHSDTVQLCAQAICLEEMVSVPVPKGALFYGKTRRRVDVNFDEALRQETMDIVQQTRDLIAGGITPPPVYSKRCESCSIFAECLPKAIMKNESVKSYLSKMVN